MPNAVVDYGSALGSSGTRDGGGLGAALFLLCVFPYLSLVGTAFDTQPYAIVCALFALLLLIRSQDDVRLPNSLLPFGAVLIYATVMLLPSSDLIQGLRSLVGYVSLSFISLAAFFTFKNVRGKLFPFVVLTWLVVGVIQLAIDIHFGSFILPRLSTSATRGITSLAVEPSLYAVVCIYFFILNDIFFVRRSYSKNVYLSVFAMTALQIVFARSGVGILLFFVYLISRWISQKSVADLFKGFAALVSLVAAFVLAFQYVPALRASRGGTLLDSALVDPSRLLSSDGSINSRIFHVLVSNLSVLHGNVLGFGLGNWRVHAGDVESSIGGDFVRQLSVGATPTESARIMSGWGTAIFELGLVGLVPLLAFIYLMYRGWRVAEKGAKKIYLSSFFTIYGTMLMAVPLAFPLFGYVVGVFAYLSWGSENSSARISSSSRVTRARSVTAAPDL